MELTGKIIAILPAKSGVSQRGNNWMTQQFVLEVPGQYPKKMVFEIFGEDRIKQANIQMGDEVNVAFDIDASEYNGKWYNQIRAYNVVHIDQQQQQASPVHYAATQSQQQQPPQPSMFPPEVDDNGNPESADDLPF